MNNINNFSNWDTNEIIEWVDSYESNPQLRNINNVNTYKQSIIELFSRRNVDKYFNRYLFFIYV